MTDQHEYFLDSSMSYRDMPEALWRRRGGQWEYLSTITWSWHPVVPGKSPREPNPARLRPVEATTAQALAADRQHWVQYWALRTGPPSGPVGGPRTVVRRRASPERILDEAFTIDYRWEHTTGIVEWEEPGFASNPPHLTPIDPPAARRLLRELHGVTDAIAL